MRHETERGGFHACETNGLPGKRAAAGLDGVEKLAKAVKVTLGQRRAWCSIRSGGPRHYQGWRHGGQEARRPFENMGAQMVREVASKTSDVAGDGTTTATVLAESIYREGLRNVTGANPMG